MRIVSVSKPSSYQDFCASTLNDEYKVIPVLHNSGDNAMVTAEMFMLHTTVS